MNQLEYITDSLNSYPDYQVLFDDAINIKASPHIALFTCHGACVGPDGVYLMDSEGQWDGPLKENQVNAGLVISSLFQRLKAMELKSSVVVAKYDQEINATIFE